MVEPRLSDSDPSDEIHPPCEVVGADVGRPALGGAMPTSDGPVSTMPTTSSSPPQSRTLVRAVISAWLCTSPGWGSGVARACLPYGACLPDREPAGSGQRVSGNDRQNGIQQKPLNRCCCPPGSFRRSPAWLWSHLDGDRMPPSRSPSRNHRR